MPIETGLTRGDGAIVLAGGRGSRLGWVDKPELLLAGGRLLDRALAAVAPARTVVVGPARRLPAEVLATREEPAGSGPAAGIAAGFAALPDTAGLVAVVAADLPALRPATLHGLARTLRADPTVDGAAARDTAGSVQLLVAVVRARALGRALAARDSWAGESVRSLLAPLLTVLVTADDVEDIDEPADLLRWTTAELIDPAAVRVRMDGRPGPGDPAGGATGEE